MAGDRPKSAGFRRAIVHLQVELNLAKSKIHKHYGKPDCSAVGWSSPETLLNRWPSTKQLSYDSQA